MKVNIFPHLQNSDEQYVLVDGGWQPHLRQVFTAGLVNGLGVGGVDDGGA